MIEHLNVIFYLDELIWNNSTSLSENSMNTYLNSDFIPVHQTSIWSIFYFGHFIYLLFIFTGLLYLLPTLLPLAPNGGAVQNSSFTSLDGGDLLRLLLVLPILILTLHVSWCGPATSVWFGHITFAEMQFKLTYVLYFFIVTYLIAVSTGIHSSSVNVLDYLVSVLNFFFWTWFTSFSSNVFSFIFFLELLSAATTLFLVTSSFASSHFHNNLSFSRHSYFSTSMPTSFLQMIMLFFWLTLVSSLTLFLLLLFSYLKFFSYDFSLLSTIFTFTTTVSSLWSAVSVSFVWLTLLACIFIKCGIAPFYLWNPAFFRGMSLNALFFYVYVYYFTVFFLSLYVTFFYLNEIFMFHLYVSLALVAVATLILPSILTESYYINTFLALSSVLNSILLIYALCNPQTSDSLFLI